MATDSTPLTRTTRNVLEKQNGFTIALAGNPNVGKSTVFNRLTGLKQHTGNWPGKTVIKAEGAFCHRNRQYILIDLPGAYSLHPNSSDEQVARNFICFSRPDVTIVVCDATCLERNLNLVLQIMEITERVLVCVNLMDEAKRKGIHIDTAILSQQLGIPVVATSARSGVGLEALKNILDDMISGKIVIRPQLLTYDPKLEAVIKNIEERLSPYLPDWINHRWVALRLLERDYSILEDIANVKQNEKARQILEKDLALCLQ